MTTPPTNSELPLSQEEDDGGPGFLTSMGIIFLTLGAIRLALPHVAESWHLRGMLFVLFLFLFTRYLRAALFKGAIAAIVLSAVLVCFRDRSLPAFTKPGLKRFAASTAEIATGWGAGEQFAQIVEWKRRSHSHIIKGATKPKEPASTAPRWSVPMEHLAPYVEATEAREPVIRDKAIELTKGCPDDDEICEVAKINRFVSTKITYRKDPRGRTDFVQKATKTLEAEAGDCEDQTILLVSLLEAVGKRSLLAFSPGHAYPVVCFDKVFAQRVMTANRRAGQDQAYQQDLFAPGGWPHGDRPVQTLVIDGATCFPLEPTDSDAYVGYPHDKEAIHALVDPVERQYVRFTQERTTGLSGI